MTPVLPVPPHHEPLIEPPLKSPEIKGDLNKDATASGKRLLELQAGRDRGDIPLTDEYWRALQAHNKAHGK